MEGFSRYIRRRIALPIHLKLGENTYLIILSVAVGVAGGLGAFLFRKMIELVQLLLWGDAGNMLAIASDTPSFLIILVPAIGGAIVSPIILFFAREARGHGVPEVMEAIKRRGGRIRPRVALAKIVASSFTIGSGGSVGREGPIVQIGSAFGSLLGQILHIPPARLKVLVGCGAAAGIAATFNAPIGGSFFALEIILANFAMDIFGPIVISSVTATVISHILLGKEPAFSIPAYSLVSAAEIPAYALLGLLAGLIAHLFIRLIYRFEEFFENLPLKMVYLKPVIGGLVIGLVALFFPYILGIGYETITLILNEKIHLTTGNVLLFLTILIPVKLLATSITLGSGGSGGIFSPSLFLGASMGGAFGYGLHALLPDLSARYGAYSLVGMAAMVSGTTHAPITAVLMIFEMTGDYKIILPLMVACAISSLITKTLKKESIYTEKLARRGIDFMRSPDGIALSGIMAGDVMHRDFRTVSQEETLKRVSSVFLGYERSTVFVCDGGRIRGLICLSDLKELLAEEMGGVKSLLLAHDLMREEFPVACPGDPLTSIVERFWFWNLQEIPVVDSLAGMVPIGILCQRDVMGAYGREVLKKTWLATEIDFNVHKEANNRVHLKIPKEYMVERVLLPPPMKGKTLKEIDLRRNYGVFVIEIIVRAPEGGEINIPPDPEIVFKGKETLVVMGRMERIRRLKELQ